MILKCSARVGPRNVDNRLVQGPDKGSSSWKDWEPTNGRKKHVRVTSRLASPGRSPSHHSLTPVDEVQVITDFTHRRLNDEIASVRAEFFSNEEAKRLFEN